MIGASYDVYLRDQAARTELFPTDAQIAACLWDGLNYVQSNGPHIQCYLQIPPGKSAAVSLVGRGVQLKSKAYFPLDTNYHRCGLILWAKS